MNTRQAARGGEPKVKAHEFPLGIWVTVVVEKIPGAPGRQLVLGSVVWECWVWE